MDLDDAQQVDPIGLIREAYRIEGIGPGECRSIFLDWAIRLPAGQEPRVAITRLLQRYAGAAPDHPMTAILRDGLESGAAPRRRGGYRGRARSAPPDDG